MTAPVPSFIDYGKIGRIAGLILLVQALAAIPVYTEIGMMKSVISLDFLAEAAPDATMIRVAVYLTFLLSGATVAVALLVMPAFRALSERLFWLYFALAVVGLATTAMESIVVREMLAMSLKTADPGFAGSYDALAPIARAEWSAAHFFNLVTGHLKAFVFSIILLRFELIPRLLAGLGVATTIVSMAGTSAALLGIPFSYYSIAPAGIAQLLIMFWLIAKGFRPPQNASGTKNEFP